MDSCSRVDGITENPVRFGWRTDTRGCFSLLLSSSGVSAVEFVLSNTSQKSSFFFSLLVGIL